jgi:hypothetical protein
MSEQTTEIEDGPDESTEVRCPNCGTMVEESDTIGYDGEPHCEDCLSCCDACHATVLRDDVTVVGGSVVCDSCIWRCDGCGGDRHPDDESYIIANGNRICDGCAEDYHTCENCSEMFHCDDMHMHQGSAYCEDCRPESGAIASYHSSRRQVRPLPSPFTRALGGRYFGVELEVEATGDRDEAADRIDAWVNNQAADITADGHRDKVLYFEEDGSLDDGFEMISAPLGLDDHARLWKVALAPSMVKGLKSHDTTTCGLHVHVSRAQLSDLHISKIVCFVNDPDNRKLIESVARRYDTGYCHVSEKKLGTAHKDNGNRYQAVNLCNSRTIEFRIFRGSLRYATVMAAIELTNAIVSFCDMGSGAGFNLKTPAFLDFLASAAMRKHTAHLRLYLADKLPGVTLPAGFRPVNL